MIERAGIAAVCGALFMFPLAACVPDPANPPPGGTPVAAGQPSRAAPSAARAFWVGATITAIEFAPTAENGGRSAGARLDFLLPGSAADKAGLREGDVVLTCDGKPIGTTADLVKAINSGGAKAVPVTLLRDGRPLTLVVTPEPRPATADTMFRDAKKNRLEAEQAAGAAAKAAGDFKAAFDHYVAALRLLFGSNDPEAGTSYNADVAQIAAIVPRLSPPPKAPAEATRHSRRALAILKSAATDEDNDRAVNEFGMAIYASPWLADLYLNLGLVEAKAGAPERAVGDLRRYLLLKPAAPDSSAVEQKIAELEVLSDERKPWYPFLGTGTLNNSNAVLVTLRGRRLKVAVLKTGEVLCSGTIHGPEFQGKCVLYIRPEAVKCLGSKLDVDAAGKIDPTDTTLPINYRGDVTYNTQTCQITDQEWTVYVTLHASRLPAAKS